MSNSGTARSSPQLSPNTKPSCGSPSLSPRRNASNHPHTSTTAPLASKDSMSPIAKASGSISPPSSAQASSEVQGTAKIVNVKTHDPDWSIRPFGDLGKPRDTNGNTISFPEPAKEVNPQPAIPEPVQLAKCSDGNGKQRRQRKVEHRMQRKKEMESESVEGRAGAEGTPPPTRASRGSGDRGRFAGGWY